MVKKLLRYLPTKFAAHKVILQMTTNTVELMFDKLMGILKTEEMETNNSLVFTTRSASRSIALVADKDGDSSLNLEDAIWVMLARNIGKMMNPFGGRNQYGRHGCDRGDGRRREGLKFYECEGVGHMRVDCLVAQRREIKSSECRGVLDTYGVSKLKEGKKSFIVVI